jgi:hypothetical protein
LRLSAGSHLHQDSSANELQVSRYIRQKVQCIESKNGGNKRGEQGLQGAETKKEEEIVKI